MPPTSASRYRPGLSAPAPTDAPVSTLAPTERPTAAPRATPANSADAGGDGNITAPPGVLDPLQPLDSGAMFSELTDAEKGCIGEEPRETDQVRRVSRRRDHRIGFFSPGSYLVQHRSARNPPTAFGQRSKSSTQRRS